MKKLLTILMILVAGVALGQDNTAALQASIDLGNYTAPAGHGVYNVTSLNIHHNFNLNGNKINCTSSTNTGCLVFPAGYKHLKVSNGEIYGQSDAASWSGTVGINMVADSDTVASVKLHKFQAYGIIAAQVNQPVVINSNIYDCGIDCFNFNTNTAPKQGPVCLVDTFDNSMLSPLVSLVQSALQIRGAVGDTVNGSYIYKCVFKGPYKPTNTSFESTEARFTKGTVYSQCYFNGYRMGPSVVGSDGAVVEGSTLLNQMDCGIELANSYHCLLENNSISNQVTFGVLMDTNSGLNNLVNNNIRGCPGGCVSLQTGSSNNIFTNNTLTAVSNGYAVHLSTGVNNALFYRNSFVGPSSTRAIQSDNGTGSIRVYGGTIANFQKAIGLFGNTAITFDNIYMSGVSMIGTASGLYTTLSNGATVGTNIKVN